MIFYKGMEIEYKKEGTHLKGIVLSITNYYMQVEYYNVTNPSRKWQITYHLIKDDAFIREYVISKKEIDFNKDIKDLLS